MKSFEDIMAEIEAKRADAADAADEERTILAAAMMASGVTYVNIEFYGSGDSGSVEDITIQMREGYTQPPELKDKLETFAYAYLEGVGLDWYNNEGGQGEIEFDLTQALPVFRAHVDINYTESKREHDVEEAA